MSPPLEKELPDEDGWWVRLHCHEVEWFKVALICSRSDEPSQLQIYVPELVEYIPVARFNHGRTRWFGPVMLPDSWDYTGKV